MEVINSRTDPDGEPGQNAHSGMWTSPKRIKQDGTKFDVPYSKDQLEAECERAVSDGDLIAFAGLYAPASVEHLQAIIKAEQEAEITRKILVGKANRLIQQQKEAGSA